MTENGLDKFLQRAGQRIEARQAQHRADVAHVQEHHPEIADWLSFYVRLFGRGEVTYRVTLREKSE